VRNLLNCSVNLIKCVLITEEIPSSSKMHVGGHARSQSSTQDSCFDKSAKMMESSSDSGFISGPCTADDLSCMTSSSDLGASSSASHSKCYSRLDSGVDVSDSVSRLNISCDDLMCKSTESHLSSIPEPVQLDFYFGPDEDGDTQLHVAIMEGNLEAAIKLISLVPHPSLLDLQNNEGQTPLHISVLAKQPRVARLLVIAGAKVDLRDHFGNTPVHLACHLGDVESLVAVTQPISVQELEMCRLCYVPFAQPLPQQINLKNYDGKEILFSL